MVMALPCAGSGRAWYAWSVDAGSKRKEAYMGQGPKVIEGLQLTPEERRDRDEEWVLNPKIGEASPKPSPSKPQPTPVRIAHRYTD